MRASSVNRFPSEMSCCGTETRAGPGTGWLTTLPETPAARSLGIEIPRLISTNRAVLISTMDYMSEDGDSSPDTTGVDYLLAALRLARMAALAGDPATLATACSFLALGV
jgi:hypothetical protein